MDDYRAGVLIDLDGTLVDSVYHHVLAWTDVFRARGLTVPLFRVHAAIGMGGERLVPYVVGRPVDEVDAMKQEHEQRFLERADDLCPTDGALDLLRDLEVRKVPYIIATSATTTVLERLLAALGRDDLRIVHGDDVTTTKPAPEPVLVASEQLGVDPRQATFIGDSVWDAASAQKVGMRALAVRTGGFSDAALHKAGAADVVDDPRALIGRL